MGKKEPEGKNHLKCGTTESGVDGAQSSDGRRSGENTAREDGGRRWVCVCWGGGGERHKSSIELDADKARNVFFCCHGCELTMKNKHALWRCLRLNAFSSCNCHLDLSRINLYFPLSDTQCRHVPPCTRLAVHTQLAVYYGATIKRPCNIAPPPPPPHFLLRNRVQVFVCVVGDDSHQTVQFIDMYFVLCPRRRGGGGAAQTIL